MPSVLFINRVFPPVAGATGKLLAELARALPERGWEVSVIAGRERLPASSEDAHSPVPCPGAKVHWVPMLPCRNRHPHRRAISYSSLYPRLWCRFLRLERHDVTVFLSDPPLQFLMAPVVQKVKRTQIVHWAQDLYPEVAERLGVLRERSGLARVLRAISTAALRRFAGIVVPGNCMREHLLTRCGHDALPSSRITVIPNWSCPEEIHPVPHGRNAFRKQHGLNEGFVVMYSGNMGLAHTFDAVVEAAALLERHDEEVRFIFIGEGGRLPEVQRSVCSRRLRNVRFLAPQPANRLAESLSAADLHLVTMHDQLGGLVVPSKFYGITAAGRPTVFIGPAKSEIADDIVRERCGSVLPGAGGEQLAECLLGWKEDSERRAKAGRRAREFAERTGLAQAAQSFDKLFREILAGA